MRPVYQICFAYLEIDGIDGTDRPLNTAKPGLNALSYFTQVTPKGLHDPKMKLRLRQYINKPR